VTSLTRYRVEDGIRHQTALAPVLPPNPGFLGRDYFAGHIPQNEQFRPTFGRSLDLDRIDAAIRASNTGIMSPITDLSRETIALDGHVSSLLQKRLGRIGALDFDVTPATGRGVDEGRAKEYAAMVREQLTQIPNFADRLTDLAWGVFDGRSCGEIEWYRYGREWAVRDLHWIHARRLSFGPDRDLRVIDPMRQTGNFTDTGFGVESVPYKFVTFRPRMFGDYQEREGLAYRTLYWSFFARLGVREQLELMEIFGKPWRILIPRTGPGMPPINVEALQQGFQALTLLGFHNTARMPANVDVQVVQPEQGAGQVHAAVITDARDVLSKLYLGNVLTTDAKATGLGSNTASVQQSGEDLLIAGDARRISETVEDKLTDAMVIVNYGPEAVTHAPKFTLRTDPPLDRNAERTRLRGAIDDGVPVALEEYRQRVGIREVRPDEPYVIRTQRPAELGQAAPPPGPEVVYPEGQAPPPGELIDAPMTAINLPEDAAGPGLPQLPPGAAPGSSPMEATDDPDLDGVDDVAALARKMTELGLERCQHGKPNRCRICGIERQRDVELVNGAPVWSIAWKPIGTNAAPSPGTRRDTPVEASPVGPPSPAAASDGDTEDDDELGPESPGDGDDDDDDDLPRETVVPRG
jgi:phage gp29-like protein